MKNSYYLAQACSQGCYKLDKKRLFSCEYFCNSTDIYGDDGATLPVHGTQKVERDHEDYESSDAMPLAAPSLSLSRTSGDFERGRSSQQAGRLHPG